MYNKVAGSFLKYTSLLIYVSYCKLATDVAGVFTTCWLQSSDNFDHMTGHCDGMLNLQDQKMMRPKIFNSWTDQITELENAGPGK